MASRLTIAQTRLQEARAAREALEAKTSTLSSDTAASEADVEAHIAAVRDARAAETAALKEVTNAQALIDLDRTAPAAAVAGSTGSSSVTVTPQIVHDPRGGFSSLAELALEARAVCRHEALPTERLSALFDNLAPGGGPNGSGGRFFAAASNPHRETNSSEGWPLPPEFRTEIWTLVLAGTDLLSMITMEPTAANQVMMFRDESTPWGGTGIQAYWRNESQKMKESKLDTAPELLPLNELYAFTGATDELLRDYPRLNARLTNGSARAIDWVASEAIMSGDGVGKPRGWMNSPAIVSVAKETGQAAASIVPKNLGKMFSRLYRGSGGSPLWVCNADILPALIDMTIGTIPVWVPSNAGIKETPDGAILGIPTKFTEHAQTLGTKGDIQLVDLAGYYAVRRTDGIQFDTSMHFWFDTGEQAFRWTFRMGGQPFMTKPITPLHGGATKSHFVLLDTRA